MAITRRDAVDVTRESYTPTGISAMKDRLARRAIEYWVWEQAGRGEMCGDGTAELGFEFATDHMPTAHADPSRHPLTHVRFPPVTADNAGPRRTTVRYESPESRAEEMPSPIEDVWATRYQPWFDAVEELFEGWEGAARSPTVPEGR